MLLAYFEALDRDDRGFLFGPEMIRLIRCVEARRDAYGIPSP